MVCIPESQSRSETCYVLFWSPSSED
uniref:Uncharacterized protein n=1 Tax=Rhizophora mucronata TaxID=61149 RepID=A0A2P2PXX4_RHIMU